MGKSPPQVIVLDSEKRFLEYTNPGMARKLLKEKKAKVFSQRPFSIMLMRPVSASFIRRKKAMAIRNFTEFFKDEREIYVQNLANAQVSCEFPVAPNRNEGFLFPNSRDPINLTQFIPFAAIKQSMDFRKMLNRRPAALQLLDQKEYESYFSNKAKAMGLKGEDGNPDVNAAIDMSEERRRRVADKTLREPIASEAPAPIHEIIESGTGPGGAARFGERQRVAHTDVMTEDEIINPRVLHLCNQVKAEIPQEERMPSQELMMALQEIPNLGIDDYEYVRAHGYYKTIKKWARQEASRLATEDEGVDDEQETASV